MKLFFLLVLVCGINSCTWLERLVQKEQSNEKGLNLSQARSRSSLVSNVDYKLHFELEKDDRTFSGETTIAFDLKRKTDEIRVDLTGAKVHSLLVNGKEEKIRYNKLNLAVRSKHFKEGRNEIQISYDMRYSTFGAGLYRFKDPKDGNVYVYTDFEPYDANLVFPSFDQPDLKATYESTVQAPKSWTVVSSTRESNISDQGKTQLWTFPKSARFSTYIFSLHAGPYHIWEDAEFETPLRLMVRQSLKDYVESEFWFKITRQGFEYFNGYFGYKYPFIKYDQVIVPDFNSGAMENVAAVTFSERYLRKGRYTEDARLKIASVVLHEMAHMWFGNLVTMKWWDDLWLNESFASIMAAQALDEGTEFKTSWQNFYGRMKQWAYWEDQLSTTHPIATEVNSTEDAFANFDGITYGKGASALKQIQYYIGKDAYKKGVQHYFKKHAFRNTTLQDFIASLEHGYGKPLDWWSKNWLKSAGVNTIQVHYECKDQVVETASLRQTSTMLAPGLRKHRTKIATFKINEQSTKLEVSKVLDFYYEGKTTNIKDLKGHPCPDAIFPNFDDMDYVLVDLDTKSLETFSSKLAQIKQPLLRQMLWRNLWNMVRDGKLPVQNYLELTLKNLPLEKDISILRSVLSNLIPSRRGQGKAMQYLATSTPEGKKLLDHYQSSFEELIWKRMNKKEIIADERLLWFGAFANIARNPKSIDRLKIIFTQKKNYPLVHANQDLRWKLLWQMSTYGKEDFGAWVESESKKDLSDSGRNWKLGIESASPAADVKERYYSRLVDPKTSDSARTQKVIAGNLFPSGQENHRMKFASRFYKDLVTLSKSSNGIFLRAFSQGLAPINCTRDAQSKMARWIEQNEQLPENVIRGLKKSMEEDQRCIKMRDISAKALKENQSI